MNYRTGDLYYPVSVWLIDIFLIGPLFLVVGSSFIDKSFLLGGENRLLILLFMAVGMFYSLPTLALTYLIFRLALKYCLSRFYIEFLSCITSVAGVVLTFYFLNSTETAKLMLLYSLSTIVSFMVRRFKQQKAKRIQNNAKRTHAGQDLIPFL